MTVKVAVKVRVAVRLVRCDCDSEICIAWGYIIYKNVHKNVGDLLGVSERGK